MQLEPAHGRSSLGYSQVVSSPALVAAIPRLATNRQLGIVKAAPLIGSASDFPSIIRKR